MKVPFKYRIYLYFISGVLVASFFSILILYYDYNNYINHGIEAGLNRGAQGAKNIIDPSTHNSFFRNPDIAQNENYTRTLQQLNNLAVTSNYPYIYTLIRDHDDTFYFIFDTDDYDAKQGETLSFSREYINMPVEVIEAYESGKITITRDYYTDEWGTFQSIYLPVLNRQNKVEFIIGVDYDASYISSLRMKMILICIMAFGATLPFIALLVLLLKRDVIKHVNELNENILLNQQENITLKNYLSNIIESMPSILVAIDENGIVTQWNQAAAIATGIPASKALGKSILVVTGFL